MSRIGGKSLKEAWYLMERAHKNALLICLSLLKVHTELVIAQRRVPSAFWAKDCKLRWMITLTSFWKEISWKSHRKLKKLASRRRTKFILTQSELKLFPRLLICQLKVREKMLSIVWCPLHSTRVLTRMTTKIKRNLRTSYKRKGIYSECSQARKSNLQTSKLQLQLLVTILMNLGELRDTGDCRKGKKLTWLRKAAVRKMWTNWRGISKLLTTLNLTCSWRLWVKSYTKCFKLEIEQFQIGKDSRLWLPSCDSQTGKWFL